MDPHNQLFIGHYTDDITTYTRNHEPTQRPNSTKAPVLDSARSLPVALATGC